MVARINRVTKKPDFCDVVGVDVDGKLDGEKKISQHAPFFPA